MEEDPNGERLRADARAFLAGDEAALGRFVGTALGLIDRGIRSGLARSEQTRDGWQKVDAEEACNRFLDAKLLDSADRNRGPARFLERLVEAEDPGKVLVASASNFTIDLLRGRTDGDIGVVGQGQSSKAPSAQDIARFADSSPKLVDRLISAEVTVLQHRHLQKLSRTDRVVLGVLLPAIGRLAPNEIDAIAERRGVPASVVRADLSRREEAWFVRQNALQQTRAVRGSERWVVARKLRIVERLARELGDDPATRPAKDILLTDFDSTSALQAATPGIRAAVMQRRQAMIEQKDRAIEELTAHLESPTLADPNYEEVAIILGRVGADAPEADRKKAANSVNVAWLRARKKLIAARRANRGDS